jgi:hypothetical protein
MEMETILRDLSIPTDLSEFVTHLSANNLPWEALSDELLKISKTFLAVENKVEMQNEALINEHIDMLLQLPIGVRLPQTFANPMDPKLALVLNPLKELTRTITGFCLQDLPKNLKIKMIRSQVHLYTVAANIPLSIGVVYAVAILRMSIDNIIKLVTTTTFTGAEFFDLMTVINFGPIPFERMVVGEIGFSFFRAAEGNGMRAKTYLKKLCRCLTELRANRLTFDINDLRRIMYGKNRKANHFNLYFGRAGKVIFELAFGVADIPDLLTKWLKVTLQTAADSKHSDSSSNGLWGSIQIFRRDCHVNSQISLSSFFGKPHEYRIVTSQAML